jgi:hypothetical protein
VTDARGRVVALQAGASVRIGDDSRSRSQHRRSDEIPAAECELDGVIAVATLSFERLCAAVV